MGSSLSQQSAVDTISQWQTRPPHQLIFDSGRREISQFMEAVDKLHQSPPTPLTNDLISKAMTRLKNEFFAVLRREADRHAGPVSTITTTTTTAEWTSSITDSTAYAFRYEDYTVSEPPSDDVTTYLRNIAERMSSSGRLAECINLYKTARKSSIHTQLRKIRFDDLKINFNAKRYLWDELKVKMDSWIQVVKICVKILFEREKDLSEKIFRGISNGAAKDECFVGTVKEFAVDLFGFAGEVCSSNQAYDKMETVLGVYDAFSWVLPNVDALFLSQQGREARDKCVEILSRIENDVVRMLHDFEKDLLHEKPVSTDENGAVHQRTEYVMEKINVIVKNKNLLTNLIKTTPSLSLGNLTIDRGDLGDTRNRGFVELHSILIIVVLKRNLQNKADRYRDPSLRQLFMMNNLNYIKQKIEGSNELRLMVGDSYMRLFNEDFESAVNSYQASICSKFLKCFKEEGLYITRCYKSRPSKTAVRNRLKEFDDVFQRIQLLHSSWTIPDANLRYEVRDSVSEKLVAAYANFIEEFRSYPEIEQLLGNNIKYSAEDLKALVLDKLFADVQVIST